MLNNQIPYNNLLSIGQMDFIVSEELKQACHLLKAKTAYLNGFLDASNNSDILSLLNQIKITELKYSMELEGHSIAFSKLFEASIAENNLKDNLAKFIINGSKTKIKDHSKISDYNIFDPLNKSFNTILREKKELQYKSYFTNLTLYTTPNNANIIKFLRSDLQYWMNENNENKDIVIHCLIHHQIRSIGVFSQLNGLISRQYSSLFLGNLANHKIVLPISKYIIKKKEAYQTLFRKAVFENEYENWCLFMIAIFIESIDDLIEKIYQTKALKTLTEARIEKVFDNHLPAKKITDIVFTQPFTKQKQFIEDYFLHRHTASSYLKKLASIGLLIEKKSGRENLYFNKAFYDILLG